MGLFSKNSNGGMMNVIRCDEQEYLVWKWHPEGTALGDSKRENSIRYGSSLRVKDGEVAVFVYKQNDGSSMDFIEGPHDQTIKTDNFPVLSSIVGLGFGGSSPFQAEIYFINLSGIIQIRFGVPYFDVFDPRFLDFAVPMAARGTITFNITDYKSFIKLHRLINFDLEQFKAQIKDAVIKYVKGVITNIPSDYGIPVTQIERRILQINEIIGSSLKNRLESDFGVNMKGFDLSAIDPDKESEGYQTLMRVTRDQAAKTTIAQTDISIQNMQDMQQINAQNMAETLRIQREEAQRAQKLQTESNFMGAHALNQQTQVLQTAAENLGQMGQMNMGGGGGMNPAGMMTGMMMGGAMGQQMAGMMNQMGSSTQQAMNTPPPMPQIQYFVNINGQNYGPYGMQQLQQMVQNGQLTKTTYVWKNGMANWEQAGNVAEIAMVFGAVPPPMPGMPGTPGMPGMPGMPPM